MAWKDLINSAIDAYFDDPFSKTMAKAVVNGIVVVIIGIITKEAIRTNLDEEERKRNKSLYGYIQDVQPNTVSISMLDRWGDKETDVQYESSDGVSSLIREGDRI